MQMMIEAQRIAFGYDQNGYSPRLLAEYDRNRLDRGDFIRVGGDALCPVCSCEYRRHPPVQGALDMTRGCDKLVKL